MNELALFAGAGGGILGGKLLGWRTVCAVECDDYARRVLLARQDDGSLDPFPIWDDVRTFDGRPWRGVVDIVTGGFPCQDISCANSKGKGIAGERSGLWSEMARIIGEVRPRFVLVENSPMLVGRGLGLVLANLAALGYDARWGIVGAWHAGAPHRRDRLWLVAYADGAGFQKRRRTIPNTTPDCAAEYASENVAHAADTNDPSCESAKCQKWAQIEFRGGSRLQNGCHDPRAGTPGALWWQSEPDVGRVAHGVASRVDRLRALGNGQVPAALALAWHILAPID
jgi:DNA (cytosine-5)-methyltransferase 1